MQTKLNNVSIRGQSSVEAKLYLRSDEEFFAFSSLVRPLFQALSDFRLVVVNERSVDVPVTALECRRNGFVHVSGIGYLIRNKRTKNAFP